MENFQVFSFSFFALVLGLGVSFTSNYPPGVSAQNLNIPGMPANAEFTTPEKIIFDGLPAQTWTVTTDDGYINTLHRIPPIVPGSPAVILQHGLLSSSAQWVENIPSNNLAYILHYAGYDVWMPNFRGTLYSMNHTSLNLAENCGHLCGVNGFSGYWDFTYHEMGIYDIPASIDLVLSTTGLANLYYVGHSEGTTVYFVMCSQRPAYRDKIKYAVLAAPVAYLGNLISPPMRLLATLIAPSLTQLIITELGPGQFLPTDTLLEALTVVGCENANITSPLCASVLFLIFGFDFPQMNETMVPVYLGHAAQGTSTKNMIHFAQGVNSGRFAQYDYGLLGNLAKYGTATPPLYRLQNVNAPMAFQWGANDWLADRTDVARLAAAVTPNYAYNPQNFKNIKVNYAAWSHVDYITAIDVVALAYDETVGLIKFN